MSAIRLKDNEGQVAWLSAEHVANLQQLALYLIAYPRDRRLFSMILYRSVLHSRTLFAEDHPDLFAEGQCQTIGCALGHGPFAGIEKGDDATWAAYSYHMFGLDPHGKQTRRLWEWCFDSSWRASDNTPEGAGTRILYMLREKTIPVDAQAQRQGEVELCYQKERP